MKVSSLHFLYRIIHYFIIDMTLRGKYTYSSVFVKTIQWLLCMVLLTMLAFSIWMLFPDKTSVASLKWFQFLQTVATFLLPPFLMAYLWSTEPIKWLHLDGRVSMKSAVCAILLMLLASPGINLLSDLNQQITLPSCFSSIELWMQQQEEAAAALTERFLLADSIGVLVVNILLMALLPAMAEELSFRGVLQHLFTPRRNTGVSHIAIWATAIVFSAIHCQFYGFIPRMLLGALFGYALAWSGSLWLPMLMHFTNNALAVIVYFTAHRVGWDTSDMDAFGAGDTWWVGVVSLVLVGILIYLLRRSTTMSSASSRMSAGN